MYCLHTGKRKISVENITFYLLKSVLDTMRSSYAIDKPWGAKLSHPLIEK